MSEEKESAADCLLAFILLIPAQLFDAFVLRQLWGWFIVPFGVSMIGMAHAYGFSVLIALVAKSPHAESKGSALSRVGRYIAFVAFCWLFGAIAHAFMG